MAESEFQWSLHRVDSHKSSACVCGVSIEVNKSRPSSFHPCIHPSILFNVRFLSCLTHGRRAMAWRTCCVFIDTGCRWTSRPCYCSPTRRTWRSWGRCCTTCTNTWTAALPSLMWVSFTQSLTGWKFLEEVQLFDIYNNRLLRRTEAIQARPDHPYFKVFGSLTPGCRFRMEGLNYPLFLLP